VVGREPNLYERAAALAVFRPTPRGTTRVTPQRPATSWVHPLATRPSIETAVTLDALRVAIVSPRAAERRGAEAALVLRAASPDAKLRKEAVTLLAAYGTHKAMPTLVRASDDPALAAEAMRGLVRLAGADAVVARARSARDPAVRRAACAALLASGDPGAAETFLSFVLEPARRADALAALELAPASRVTAALIPQLGNSRINYRLAAARALAMTCGGQAGDHHGTGGNPVHNGPSVTAAALQQLLERNVRRREVLAALLQCQDEDARRYIATLRADRSIDSELRALERELAQLFG
jgi:hypothetical protein